MNRLNCINTKQASSHSLREFTTLKSLLGFDGTWFDSSAITFIDLQCLIHPLGLSNLRHISFKVSLKNNSCFVCGRSHSSSSLSSKELLSQSNFICRFLKTFLLHPTSPALTGWLGSSGFSDITFFLHTAFHHPVRGSTKTPLASVETSDSYSPET